MGFTDRLAHAWNAFLGRDAPNRSYEYGSSGRPDRSRFTRGNGKSVASSLLSRIAMDAAQIDIKHVRLDDNGRYKEEISSDLNYCLNVAANTDQTGRAFRQDVFASMLDEGVVAIVPTVTDIDPEATESYKILSMRTGRITEWFPQHVRVNVYNEETGRRQDITLPKSMVAIVENPLYAVMNEPNSTLRRLVRKMNLLDEIDERSNSGRLDLIIQLPYTVKSSMRRAQAEKRRNDIEAQLTNGKYGIAYIDGTEKIVQLNRPIENNLLDQIKHLTEQLHSELGMAEAIFNGTADEKVSLDYYNRTIEPMVAAVVDEMYRKFLTKTARTQRQSIRAFRDPFRLVPITELVNVADTFTRNEILSSNELRALIGFKPSDDPKADELRNKNLNQSNEELGSVPTVGADDNDSGGKE